MEAARRRPGKGWRVVVARAIPGEVPAEEGHGPAVMVLRVEGPLPMELIEQAAPKE